MTCESRFRLLEIELAEKNAIIQEQARQISSKDAQIKEINEAFNKCSQNLTDSRQELATATSVIRSLRSSQSQESAVSTQEKKHPIEGIGFIALNNKISSLFSNEYE